MVLFRGEYNVISLTSEIIFIYRPYGTLIVGGNAFYKYSVPKGTSISIFIICPVRDNIFMEKISASISPITTVHRVQRQIELFPYLSLVREGITGDLIQIFIF